MSEPYYSDDLVTLYHGDCLTSREWLSADVLVTDPPYGMGYTGFGGRPGKNDGSRHERIAGDKDCALRDAALGLWGNRPALVFGTWKCTRPHGVRQLIVWDKRGGGGYLGDLKMPWWRRKSGTANSWRNASRRGTCSRWGGPPDAC